MFYVSHLTNNGKKAIKLSFTQDVRKNVIERFRQIKIYQNAEEEEINKIIDDFTVFQIGGFQALRDSVNIWKDIFASVDYVFSKLSDEEIGDYIFSFINWHYEIKVLLDNLEEVDNQTELLHEFCLKMSEELVNITERLQFRKHTIAYCDTLLIDDDPLIGTREQDSEETTFYPAESREVCCIIAMTKLFLPVIASMISESKNTSTTRTFAVEGGNTFVKKKQKLINTDMKEVYCLYFIEPILKESFSHTYDKLFNYGIHFVNNKNKKKKLNTSQCSDVFMNHSLVEMNKQVMAILFCKKGIQLSLTQKSETIMNFIMGEIKKKITNLEKAKKQFFVRSIQMGMEGEDEGNEAQLEADSTISETMIDKEPLTKWICDWIIKHCIEKYKLDKKLVEEAADFYARDIDILDKYIPIFINSVYHRYFETCESVEMLNQVQILRLVTILQMVCLERNHFDLAVKITSKLKYTSEGIELAEPRDEYGSVVSCVDMACKNIYHKLIGCKTKIDLKDKDGLAKEGKITLKKWAIYFTQYQSYIHMHPVLLQKLNSRLPEGVELTNKDGYYPSTALMHQICDYIDEGI